MSEIASERRSEPVPDEPASTALIESVFDNLPVWTVIAAAITFLYLVWATIEVLSRYVGGIPKVTV